jgi:hypothetical protein
VTFLTTPPRLTEKQFMARVVKYAELMGWHAYHTFDSRRSAPGFPDLVLIRRPRLVFAEIKTDRGTLTTPQFSMLVELRECGQEAYVWRPAEFDQVARILR